MFSSESINPVLESLIFRVKKSSNSSTNFFESVKIAILHEDRNENTQLHRTCLRASNSVEKLSKTEAGPENKTFIFLFLSLVIPPIPPFFELEDQDPYKVVTRSESPYLLSQKLVTVRCPYDKIEPLGFLSQSFY